MENDSLFALWLLIRGGAASETNFKAIKTFTSFKKIYGADFYDFPRNIFSPDEIKLLSDKDLSEAKRVYSYCEKNDISIITFFSEKYPPLLREIPCPPILLFCRGTLPNFLKEPSLTVVGSRKCDIEYGKTASKICYELAIGNFIIVSGVAAGADMFAHKGALMAGGKSVAVLPCGVDINYSSSSAEAEKFIIKNGALISEYLPGTPALKYHFEQRNRILSGISPATLIVCAEKNSGSMITVKHAEEQGKCIFALPGNPAAKLSEGTNELLKTGAVLCRNSIDIFDEYNCIFDGKLPEKELFIKKIKETKNALIKSRYNRGKTPEKKTEEQNTVEIQNHKTSLSNEAFLKKTGINKKKAPQKISETKEKAADPEDNKIPEPTLSEKQREIYSVLKETALSADSICSLISRPFPEIIFTLQEMALNEIVEEKSGGQWALKQ